MYDIVELLANLTERPISPERITGQETGHVPRISPDSVAFALAKIKDPGAALLLRVKFAMQYMFIRDLHAKLYVAIINLAHEEEWPEAYQKRPNDIYGNLGRLAIVENLATHICTTCEGREHDSPDGPKTYVMVDGKLEECQTCGGTGKIRPNEWDRAKAIGLDSKQWSQYRPRYNAIRGILDRWEAEARVGFRSGMFE